MGEIKIRLEKESLNENQVFNENISIDLVEIIETNNRAIFYPFDIPTKQEEDVSRILGYRPKSKIGQAIYGRFVLGMGVSCVMVLAILLALALGLPHPGM